MAKDKLLNWLLYEITSSETLNNVMLRGRLRKLAIQHNFNLLTENTQDIENGVRFAILSEEDASVVIEYLESILSSPSVECINTSIQNPVLSKLKVNASERYII